MEPCECFDDGRHVAFRMYAGGCGAVVETNTGIEGGMEFGDVDETAGFDVEQCTEVLVVEAYTL